MAKPVVAIVGRPNVGKSTLFNRLVGKRLALVDDQPGVTRDRREGDATLVDLDMTVVDTAGWEDEEPASLPGRMRAQTEAAVGQADVALFVIDGRAGVTPLDEEIARALRGGNTPVVLVANKAEGRAAEEAVLDAYRLGLGEAVALSAEHGEGLADLWEALDKVLPGTGRGTADGGGGGVKPGARDDKAALAGSPLHHPASPDGPPPRSGEDIAPLKLAIVGRPNAGKSTLINRMLGEDRLLVGPEAGITRDSIAVDWSWTDGEGTARPVRLIDTAGMRKRAKVDEKLERLAVQDARRAIDFAEVVVLLLDATRGLEGQDLRIADAVLEEGRALLVALNKWDVAEDASRLFQGVRAALEEGLSQVRGLPLLTVSGATGKGVDQLLAAAFTQRALWSRRVPTGELNRWFERMVEANPPPAPSGQRIKLRYVTQVGTRPPQFAIFGNRLDALPDSYRRYLVNGLRRDFGLDGVPIRLNLRSRSNPFDRK